MAARSSLATADAASFVVPAEIMRVLERVPCDGRDFERLATGLCQARHGRRIVTRIVTGATPPDPEYTFGPRAPPERVDQHDGQCDAPVPADRSL